MFISCTRFKKLAHCMCLGGPQRCKETQSYNKVVFMSTISFDKNTSKLYSNTLSKKGAQQEESLIYCTLCYTTLFTERQCNEHAQVHIEPFLYTHR